MLYEKLNLNGDIYWIGSKVKSKYPFDIKIGEAGISLKEDSYIIKIHLSLTILMLWYNHPNHLKMFMFLESLHQMNLKIGMNILTKTI